MTEAEIIKMYFNDQEIHQIQADGRSKHSLSFQTQLGTTSTSSRRPSAAAFI